MEYIIALVTGLILVGLGLVFLRSGYSLFRILLFISVFLTFGFLSFLTTTTLTANPILGIIVGFILGVIAAALAYFFYKIAIALTLAGLVYNLISILLIQLNFWAFLVFLIAGLFAVIAFFAGLNERFTRFYIILTMSLQGAYLFVLGVLIILYTWTGLDLNTFNNNASNIEALVRSLDPFWSITFWISLISATYMGYIYQDSKYTDKNINS